MSEITGIEQLRAAYPAARERSVLKELPALDAHARRFVALSPFAVLSTGGPGGADCSPRGGAPGFVQVVDNHTLLLADSPGNNRLDTLQNLLHNPQIGLLLLVPGVDETLRVNGRATLSTDAAERERCADQLSGQRRVPPLVLRIAVQACYLHCAKALMRSQLWNPALHIDRATLPSMGEMLRDQIADRTSPGTAWETQDEMLARYRQTL